MKKSRVLLLITVLMILCIAAGGWLWWRAQPPLIPEGACSRETLQDMETGEWRSIDFDALYWFADPQSRELEHAVKDLINSLPVQRWDFPVYPEVRFRLVLSNSANGGSGGPVYLAAFEGNQVRVVDIMDDGIWIRGEDVYYRCEGAADRVREVYDRLPVAQDELYLISTMEDGDPDSIETVVFDLGYLYQYDRREKVFSLLGI